MINELADKRPMNSEPMGCPDAAQPRKRVDLEEIKERINLVEKHAYDVLIRIKDLKTTLHSMPMIMSNEQEAAFCKIATQILNNL